MVCSKNIVTTTNELFCCQGIERSLILRFALIRIFVTLLARKRKIRRGIYRGIFNVRNFQSSPPLRFHFFPGLKTSFYESGIDGRWTSSAASCRVYSLVTRIFPFLVHHLVYSAQNRFCHALSLIPIFASGPFHFSRFLLCHTRISSNSIVQSGIWRFSILPFHRSLRDIIVDIFIRRQSLFPLFPSLRITERYRKFYETETFETL